MKRERAGLRRVERRAALPAGFLQPVARIELCERQQAIVEGCAALLGCGEEEITLKTARGAVRIRGAGLLLQTLAETEAVVTGEILSVEFI